jgi:hypothetical protein
MREDDDAAAAVGFAGFRDDAAAHGAHNLIYIRRERDGFSK